MTTKAWVTSIGHTSDIEFRAWGLELQTRLLAAGLVADEKTTNWTTATRPGTNTEYGYEVYHLADSLHATAPIYIRFGFGTGATATTPRLQFTVGQNTDGGGVLGGTCLTTIQTVGSAGGTSTRPLFISLLCVAEGFFGLLWKCGSNSGASPVNAFMAICRSCDNTGTPTATGAIIVQNPGLNPRTQCMRFAATATAYTANTAATTAALGMNPQLLLGGENFLSAQAFVGWMAIPNVLPIFGLCGTNGSDIFGSTFSPGVTFKATLVGTTPRTYINIGYLANSMFFSGAFSGNQSDIHYAMLWE